MPAGPDRALLDLDPLLLYPLLPELERTTPAGREAAPSPDVQATDARTNPGPALPLLAWRSSGPPSNE